MAGSNQWRPVIQVPTSHYGATYLDWDKWISFYWQIKTVIATGSQDVLEIGVGNRIVSSTMKQCGLNVIGVDIDATLQPDVVASVTSLPFPDNEFDMVICCEVLEHMPYDFLLQAANELRRVTRRFCLVSVPHATLSFAALVRCPIIHLRELRVRIPFPRTLLPGGEHYWECGRLGYSIRRLRRDLCNVGFRLVSESRPPTNYSHVFFLLERV